MPTVQSPASVVTGPYWKRISPLGSSTAWNVAVPSGSAKRDTARHVTTKRAPSLAAHARRSPKPNTRSSQNGATSRPGASPEGSGTLAYAGSPSSNDR